MGGGNWMAKMSENLRHHMQRSSSWSKDMDFLRLTGLLILLSDFTHKKWCEKHLQPPRKTASQASKHVWYRITSGNRQKYPKHSIDPRVYHWVRHSVRSIAMFTDQSGQTSGDTHRCRHTLGGRTSLKIGQELKNVTIYTDLYWFIYVHHLWLIQSTKAF